MYISPLPYLLASPTVIINIRRSSFCKRIRSRYDIPLSNRQPQALTMQLFADSKSRDNLGLKSGGLSRCTLTCEIAVIFLIIGVCVLRSTDQTLNVPGAPAYVTVE